MRMDILMKYVAGGFMSIEQFIASLAASDLSLQGKLDALRAEFEANLAPPPIVAALHRATDELIASGAAD